MVESADAHLEPQTSAEQPLTAVDLGLEQPSKGAQDSKPDLAELPSLDPAADTALQDGATVVPFTGVESQARMQAAVRASHAAKAPY